MMTTRLLIAALIGSFAGACGGPTSSSKDPTQPEVSGPRQHSQAAEEAVQPDKGSVDSKEPSSQGLSSSAPREVSRAHSEDGSSGGATSSVGDPVAPAPAAVPMFGPDDSGTAPAAMPGNAQLTAAASEQEGPGSSDEGSVGEAVEAPEKAEPQVRVTRGAEGQPVLQVQCPWHDLPRPSVQVSRLRSDGNAASDTPLPLDGVAAEEIWEKQVSRLNKPTYPNSTELVKTSVTYIDRGEGELVTLRGRKNSLGKESAYAVDERTGTPVIFYLLDDWADEQRRLHFALSNLDLTREFDEPGEIHIWLLSNEQVVWDETVDWPGEQVGDPVVQSPDTSPEEPQDSEGDPAGPSNSMPESPTLPGHSNAPAQPPVPAPDDVGPAPPMPVPPEAATAPQAPPKRPAAPGPDSSKEATTSPLESEANAMSDNPEAMPIDRLTGYIEKEFSSDMSPKVRLFWLHGLRYYYKVKNPPATRRRIFMDMLRSAYDEDPPAELRQVFKVLYQKLKAEQEKAGD